MSINMDAPPYSSLPRAPGNWPFGSLWSNEVPQSMCMFKCPECQINKSTPEDLQVHIKLEHLRWLPFQCPICRGTRASDLQMREHLQCSHKRSDLQYIYIDNIPAQGILNEMMNKSLLNAIHVLAQRRGSQTPAIGNNQQPNGTDLRALPNGNSFSGVAINKRKRLHDVLSRNIQHEQDEEKNSSSVSPADSLVGATATIVTKSSDILNGLTNKRRRSVSPSVSLTEIRNESNDVNQQIANLFRASSSVEDDDHSGVASSLLNTLQATNPLDEETTEPDPASLVNNLFNAFSFSNFGNPEVKRDSSVTSQTVKRRRGFPQSSAKKRVLGQCSKCQKPVTAGARQMHMFFHLGRDEDTYRFQCKYPNCNIQHYRKDQMENHMSKVHGSSTPEMMIDRSAELYERVQRLSIELLGPVGNAPTSGAASNQGSNKQDRESTEEQKYDEDFEGDQAYASGSAKNGRNASDENLECKLCHKFIINRTRGFHILWHLCNDLGIIRYRCKLCDYKHERAPCIMSHGKKEHGTENVVEDSLNQYEEEVKSMSKACFGLEQLFKENKKKTSEENQDDGVADEGALDENVYNSHYAEQDSAAHVNSQGTSASAGKRRIVSRRFGVRRPRSKKQKEKMAKLREISLRIGGATYFKKRSSYVSCEECGKTVSNRLTHHAYSHLSGAHLFLCPRCSVGHYSRDMVIRHLKDYHNCSENPTDNRLQFALEIKDMIHRCYPSIFIDAPLPDGQEMALLKSEMSDMDAYETNDNDETVEEVVQEDGQVDEFQYDQEPNDDQGAYEQGHDNPLLIEEEVESEGPDPSTKYEDDVYEEEVEISQQKESGEEDNDNEYEAEEYTNKSPVSSDQ